MFSLCFCVLENQTLITMIRIIIFQFWLSNFIKIQKIIIFNNFSSLLDFSYFMIF